MNGWVGNILRVNLTQGNYTVEELDPDIAKDYLGGGGLGVKFLYDEIDPTIDPLGPDNKLIFSVSSLVGTGSPTTCHCAVVSKSPLTGAIGRSIMGGYFGAELKYAGYDAIIVEGKSPEPVSLWIMDDDIQLKPAQHLWGKTIPETEDMIRAEIEDEWRARGTQRTHGEWIARETQIASVGPAGERLVRLAAILTDKGRAAARTGMGTVMGSKNLKAVVTRGTKPVMVADGEAFKQAALAIQEILKGNDLTGNRHPKYGTPIAPPLWNTWGVLPARHFQAGIFPTEAVDKIKGRSYRASILLRGKSCFSCGMGCGRLTRVAEEEFAGSGEGPEWESVALLGICCGVDNLAAIAKANYNCNELGIDTISAGNVIACAMELFEKGIITEKDVGFELRFGDPQAVVRLTREIGWREGFGDILAEGAYRMTEKYGHPEFFMGVKKLELPAFNVRAMKGMGLNLATANEGANHMRGPMQNLELIGAPVKLDPLQTEGKAEWVKKLQDSMAISDSIGLCGFLDWAPITDEHKAALLEAVTGEGYTVDNMLLAGERIWNLERLFNLRAGFTKKDDTLPKRMLEEPMPEGPGKGHVCELDQMLPEYYQLRGWDENGVPTLDKLTELGLEPI